MAARKTYIVQPGFVIYVDDVSYGEGEAVPLSAGEAKDYLEESAVVEETK